MGDLRVRTYLAQELLEPDSPYVETLRGLGRGDRGEVLVAADGDDVLGTVTLRPHRDDSEVTRSCAEGEVRALAVAPESQGRGVGRLLLHAVRDRAAAAGMRHLVLSTQPAMVAAQRLYESEGFGRLPERDWTVHPGLTLMAYGLLLAPLRPSGGPVR
ncbi:GNAT family N-acetyltransferase [Spinactinospora alkalitolerans]